MVLWLSVRDVDYCSAQRDRCQDPSDKVDDLLTRVDATQLVHVHTRLWACCQDDSEQEQEAAPLVAERGLCLIVQWLGGAASQYGFHLLVAQGDVP